MYVIAYTHDDKVTIKVTNNPIEFGMGIDEEIMTKVDLIGHYKFGNLCVFKEGTWNQ